MKRGKIKFISSPVVLCAVALCSVAMLEGCDDESSNAGPATRPTVAVATSQPTTDSAVVAAYTGRPPASVNLDGRDELFPPAKLALLGRASGGLNLRLCSDDPPAAIDPGYIGNSFVLDMRLPIDRVQDIPNANWEFKSSDADEASGIYLHGYRDQYRPADVHVSFQKSGDEIIAFVTGTFLHNDSVNPAALPQRVQVTASLRAELQSH